VRIDARYCSLCNPLFNMAELPLSTEPLPPSVYLTEPLPDLAAWKRYFLETEIPVMVETSRALEELREKEDDVDAGMLAAIVERDPLMMVKVLALVAGRRRNTESTGTETIVSSLVMMGVSPFFRHFGPQPTVEDHLRAQPEALLGVQKLIKRSERAAHFATGFAVHRLDTDVEVIRQAAFLHDFTEILMWCHAPTMQLEINAMQKSNSTLRTSNLQRFVFHIDLNDLRQELMKHWNLPELLIRISDGKHADHPIVRNVVLAVRLARHTENGWDNAALPDDIEDISQLLNASARVTRGFVYKIDQARE